MYTIVDLKDGGIYVGQTRYNALKRFSEHWRDAHNPKLLAKASHLRRPLMRAMSTSTDPREHFRVFPVAVIPKSSYVVPRNPKDTASLFQATQPLLHPW